MSFKFLVGQAVEYTPIGEKKAGLFKIVRQMPKEDQAIDAERHEDRVELVLPVSPCEPVDVRVGLHRGDAGDADHHGSRTGTAVYHFG